MITTAADTMAIKYFDTLEYVKESEKRGANSELAEYQARQMETALETVAQYVTKEQKDFVKITESQNFATKDDILRLEHATKDDIARLEKSTKSDIARLENSTKSDIARLENSTKNDITRLEKRIDNLDNRVECSFHKLRYDTLKFVIWTGVGVALSSIGTLVGLLGHGLFHWF